MSQGNVLTLPRSKVSTIQRGIAVYKRARCPRRCICRAKSKAQKRLPLPMQTLIAISSSEGARIKRLDPARAGARRRKAPVA